jgi:hypothetical protein
VYSPFEHLMSMGRATSSIRPGAIVFVSAPRGNELVVDAGDRGGRGTIEGEHRPRSAETRSL